MIKGIQLNEIAKFGLVGLSNTVITYFVYSFFVFLGIPYVISNIIGFIAGIQNAYYWSNKYVFKKHEGEERNAFWVLVKTYISYGCTGILLASILLYIYIEKFCISEYVAQLLVLVITIPLNFILNKFWSFKSKNTSKKKE